MKFPTILFAALLAVSLASCEHTTKPDPAPDAPKEVVTAAREDVPIVEEADMENVFAITLKILEPDTHIEATAVKGGYTVQVVKNGDNPVSAERTRACCGSGIGFVRCAIRTIRDHGPITVGTCASQGDGCGEYCAYY